MKVAPQDMHEKACTGETLKRKILNIFFADTEDSQARGEPRSHLYSSLPFPPAQKHQDIYFQLCI